MTYPQAMYYGVTNHGLKTSATAYWILRYSGFSWSEVNDFKYLGEEMHHGNRTLHQWKRGHSSCCKTTYSQPMWFKNLFNVRQSETCPCQSATMTYIHKHSILQRGKKSTNLRLQQHIIFKTLLANIMGIFINIILEI